MSAKPVVFGKGAEAVVYPCVWQGRRALRKVRGPKAYRVKPLDSLLRTRRTRIEAKALRAARAAGVPCPEVMEESEKDCSIVFSAIPGELLSSKKVGAKERREAGRLLGLLHSAGIVHGDYTPSNLILGKAGLSVIDFGLSSFSQSVEERAQDVRLFWQGSRGDAGFGQGYLPTARFPDAARVVERAREMALMGRYARPQK